MQYKNRVSINLPDKTYSELIDEIIAIHAQASLVARQAVETRIKACWEIGKHIVDVEQQKHMRAKYGQQLINRLAADLTRKLGRGFSGTQLRCMRQFYMTHLSIHLSIDELTWTQHQRLLTIKDDQKRKQLEKKCVQNSWSVRELTQAIKAEHLEMQDFLMKTLSAKKSKPRSKPLTPLAVKRGYPYIYKIIRPTFKESAKLCVDLGFSVYWEMPPDALQDLREGNIVCSQKDENNYSLVKSEKTGRVIYTYKAFVERVIDGDTLWCWVDLGFGNQTRQKLRLKDIDTPELSTPQGVVSKQFVDETLAEQKFIVIKTYKTDKYDRPLADIFYIPGEDNIEEVARHGIFLNQQLLDEGLAKRI